VCVFKKHCGKVFSYKLGVEVKQKKCKDTDTDKSSNILFRAVNLIENCKITKLLNCYHFLLLLMYEILEPRF
jgi:hypothetical protein